MSSSVEVLDVMHRESIPMEAIQRVVDEIVRRFSPRKIILFGSYARGNPRPESDVDLLIVMDAPNLNEQSLAIRRAVPCAFGLDLVVHTPETLKQRMEWGDFFLREAVSQGKIVYESPDR
jgi:predicted nucleotidyltransferase